MPTISLDAPVAILAAASRYLMAITSTGFFYTWHVFLKLCHLHADHLLGTCKQRHQ